MTKLIKYIIVHHTAHPTWDFNQTKDYHVNTLKWKDIGYNYFIEKNGVIVVGRSLDISGAHTLGYNSNSIGICLAGNFEEQMPTIQQLTALENLLDDLRIDYNISKSNIFGHRDVSKTECPGDNLYPFVLDYKKKKVIEQLEKATKTNSVKLNCRFCEFIKNIWRNLWIK